MAQQQKPEQKSEIKPLTKEEQEKMLELPDWILKDGKVTYNIDNKTFIKHLMREMKLDATDFYVNKVGEVCIRKNGRYKYALQSDVTTNKVGIEATDYKTYVVIYAIVQKETKTAYDHAICTMDEGKGKFFDCFNTATTRAILRAQWQLAPLTKAISSDSNDEDEDPNSTLNQAANNIIKEVEQKKTAAAAKKLEKTTKELANIDKVLESEDPKNPLDKAKKDLQLASKELKIAEGPVESKPIVTNAGPNDDLKGYIFMPCLLQNEFEVSWEIRTNTNRTFIIPKKYLKIMDPKTDGGIWILKDYVPEMTKPKTELDSYSDSAQVPNETKPIFSKVKATKRAEK